MVAAWLVAVAAWPAGAPGGVAASGRGGAAARAYPAGAGPGAWWFRVAAAPYRAWDAMWRLTEHGHLVAAAVAAAPPAIPLGIVAGGACWAYRQVPDAQRGRRAHPGGARRVRRQAVASPGAGRAGADRRARVAAAALARRARGGGGDDPRRRARCWSTRCWSTRGRSARGRRPPRSPTSGCARTRWSSGRPAPGRPRCCCGCGPGSWPPGCAGTPPGAGRRPLLVVLDCKGGASSRKVADRTRRVLRDAGARSTAIWPDEASLSLWTLPPDRLVTTLLDLIEHGTGGAAYLHRRDGGARRPGGLRALRPARELGRLPRQAGRRLAGRRLRCERRRGRGRHHSFGEKGLRRREAAVPGAVAAARRRARRRLRRSRTPTPGTACSRAPPRPRSRRRRHGR